jgi:aralkylamine N-acetyltransferase
MSGMRNFPMMTDRQAVLKYRFMTNLTSDQVRQIIALYQEEGWWDADDDDDPELVSRIVSGSHCFLLAFEREHIVGMGRAISDRVSDAYIQDVKVLLSHQGRGIGRTMIHMLAEHLRADGLRWIGLIAEKETYRFYEKLGFMVMPSSKPMLMKR